MMKAYDSVSLESLQLALRRLDISEKFVIWITGLFKNRQMNVITAFSPSSTFIGGDEKCNIKIYSNNPQKAIIQKQECPKIITIAQYNALVLPIFIRLSTNGSLANQIIDTNNQSHNMADNIMPSLTRTEIVAIFLALLIAPENSNVTIYTYSLDNPIEVNIR
ncbi:hypothetical protein C1646_772767 [Rhizophagus diaphanus]|nr:hypothetical protein C1646_772767 [Rhizophagus diaphanus] [Rhizophagus sp. MUCL 43196]